MLEKVNVTAAGLSLLCAALSAGAVELDSSWKIVAPENEARVITRAFARAAEVLRKDLAEGAGLKLEVVKTAPKAGHALYLGADAAKAAGLKTDDLVWYDNAIAEKDGNLYLYGNDRARSKNADSGEWFKAALPTVGAATRFLHDYLGDRFCLPGETGRYVGKRDKVVVPDGTRSVERPSQVYASEYRSDMIYSYASNLRGPGLFHSYGGHSYPRAVPREKYAKTHPEYFAMSPQGLRTGDVDGGLTALCISNPEVEDLILGELIARFDEGADACQLAQNDGDARCHCPKCKALFGTGDDWNEKFWLFHRKIAERALKLRPGKIVNILAYAQSHEPPKTFTKFPPNVMIELCAYSEEMFDKWSKVEVPQGFAVYTYSWGNYQQPGFIGRHSFAFYADLARRFRRRNVKGVYRCGQIDLFGLEGPCYHVFNKVLDDPERPVDQLVAEYCQSMFGPAATLMQRFYDTQDARLRGLDLIAGGFSPKCGNGLDRYRKANSKNNGDLHAWAYPPDTVHALEDLLSRAGSCRVSRCPKRPSRMRRRSRPWTSSSRGRACGRSAASRFSRACRARTTSPRRRPSASRTTGRLFTSARRPTSRPTRSSRNMVRTATSGRTTASTSPSPRPSRRTSTSTSSGPPTRTRATIRPADTSPIRCIRSTGRTTRAGAARGRIPTAASGKSLALVTEPRQA